MGDSKKAACEYMACSHAIAGGKVFLIFAKLMQSGRQNTIKVKTLFLAIAPVYAIAI
ncbi:hypothetical protein [Aerosakkonema funiforme]|uniref:hypothetical protein n=1 Tax=Aerosakkonema funiforme TaxID=1246630 RepID=UPI0035BB11F2